MDMKPCFVREKWEYITRNRGSRIYSIGEISSNRPYFENITKSNTYDIVDWLDVEHNKRYLRNDKQHITYCNVYVFDFLYEFYKLGFDIYLPRVWWNEEYIHLAKIKDRNLIAEYPTKKSNGNIHELSANALYIWLCTFGRDYFGWKSVETKEEIQELANKNKICIISGFNKISGMSGHICVVLPEYNKYKVTYYNNKLIMPLTSQAGYNNWKYKVSNWFEVIEKYQDFTDSYKFFYHEG